jgi:hypothetical protein
MVRPGLDCAVDIGEFVDGDAAQLLGGSVSSLSPQGLGGSADFQNLPSARPVPAPAQFVVIGKTLLDHGFPYFIGHCVPQVLVSVSQASEFHCSLLFGDGLSNRRTFIFERFAMSAKRLDPAYLYSLFSSLIRAADTGHEVGMLYRHA